MRVVLLHAYARSNSGDGLLVEESATLIREAWPNARLLVLALDPVDLPCAVSWPDGKPMAASTLRLVIAGLTGPSANVRAAIRQADLVVGVGGGYLRGPRFLDAFKTGLVHLRQLYEAGHARRAVYLPQSIGPFDRASLALVGAMLPHVNRVFVRDDRSARQLAKMINVERAPDLAVLALATSPVEPRPLTEGLLVVARDLGRHAGYQRLVRQLAAQPRSELCLQATGRGNDDAAFAAELGLSAGRSLTEALEDPTSPVVVSVRLHGALQALLKGVPAVHLSYERKGFGAYQDLGLEEFVLNATDATLPSVLQAVARVRADSSGYWARVAERRPKLLEARKRVVASLADRT